MNVIARKPATSHVGQARPFYICIAIALVTTAIGMDAAGLSQFDYDEGVYWQSLRAMSAGYHLYGQIFCSQPPLFLLSIYPFYELLGSSIVSARVGVATRTTARVLAP
jgi:4-amino-4-deoxy-L-arabinose transferase-like glycosyltransferase